MNLLSLSYFVRCVSGPSTRQALAEHKGAFFLCVGSQAFLTDTNLDVTDLGCTSCILSVVSVREVCFI